MLIEAREAEFLCTASEFALYRESCDPWIRQFRGGRIRNFARHAAKLSAMWKDKANSDRHTERVSEGAVRRRSQTGHVLAHRKAELFAQIAARFTRRLKVIAETSRVGHGISAATTLIEKTELDNR